MISYQTSKVGSRSEQGLYVAAVAHSSDFMVGDRIIAVDGSEVATIGRMRELIDTRRAGDVVIVTVMRDGGAVDIDVTLTEADVPAGAAEPAA